MGRISKSQLEAMWNKSGGNGNNENKGRINNNYNTTNIENTILMPDYTESYENIANSIDHVAEAINRVAKALETRNEIEYVKGIMKAYYDSKREFQNVYKNIYQSNVKNEISQYFGDSVDNHSEINDVIKRTIDRYACYHKPDIYNMVDVWDRDGNLEVDMGTVENEIVVFPYYAGEVEYDISVFAFRRGRERKLIEAFRRFIGFSGTFRYITFIITGEYNDHILLDLYYLPNDGLNNNTKSCVVNGVVVHKSQVLELHKALLKANNGNGTTEWDISGHPITENRIDPDFWMF